MTVVISNEVLSKLRHEARRRRLEFREINRLWRPTTALGPAYRTKPPIKLIVSDWYTDELRNQTRIIKAHD